MNLIPQIADEDRGVTSASNFFRRALCPGSESAEMNSPVGATTHFARAGTYLHFADAHDLQMADMTQEQLRLKNQALREDYLNRQLSRLGIPLNAKRRVLKDTARYVLRDESGEILIGPDGKPFSGQPDHIVWFHDYRVLFIFDSKFGRKIVPLAENNYQVRIYVLMLADKFGDFEAEKVIGVITQPLAPMPVHGVEYNGANLQAAKVDVLAKWYASKNPDAPRIASPEACANCRALATCREADKIRKELVTLKLSEMPLDELEALAPKIEVVEALVKAYWKRIELIATKYPHLLGKFEMKQGREQRWIDAQDVSAVYAILVPALMTHDQFQAASSLSLPKLQESIATNFNLQPEAAKMELEKAIIQFIQRSRTASSIVEKEQKPVLIQNEE